MLNVRSSMSTKSTSDPGLRDRFGGGDESVRYRDNDAVLLQSSGHDREAQRIGAAAHTDAVLRVAERGEVPLKSSTAAPPTNAPFSRAFSKLAHNSSLSSSCGVTRSRKGICLRFHLNLVSSGDCVWQDADVVQILRGSGFEASE